MDVRNMSIYEKIEKAHDLIQKADWNPDQAYSIGRANITYVSGKKLKRTLGPIWKACRLDLSENEISAEELDRYRTRTVTDFIFTDLETGEQDVRRVIADAINYSASKEESIVNAPLVAGSYAYRKYVVNRFHIIDGYEINIDGEVEGEDISVGLKARAIPEQTENPVRNTPKTEEEPKEVVVPQQEEMTAKKPYIGLSARERGAADRAFDNLTTLYGKGEVVEETYLKAKAIYESLENPSQLEKLLAINREAKANLKTNDKRM